MFGLFKKAKKYLRDGVEVPETYDLHRRDLWRWYLEHEHIPFTGGEKDADELYQPIYFQLNGVDLIAYVVADNYLHVAARVPALNLGQCDTLEARERAYRCLDQVAFANPGCRPLFDPESGEFRVTFECATGKQFFADRLLDLALYLVLRGVNVAHEYLGLPAVAYSEPMAMSGNFFVGLFKRYPSASEALIGWLCGQPDTKVTERRAGVTLLQAGPIPMEVPEPGWPNLCRLKVGTTGFQKSYHDPEKYVQVQQMLDQYRDRERKTRLITHFEDNGTLIFSTAALINPGADNLMAFDYTQTPIAYQVIRFSEDLPNIPQSLFDDSNNIFIKENRIPV